MVPCCPGAGRSSQTAPSAPSSSSAIVQLSDHWATSPGWPNKRHEKTALAKHAMRNQASNSGRNSLSHDKLPELKYTNCCPQHNKHLRSFKQDRGTLSELWTCHEEELDRTDTFDISPSTDFQPITLSRVNLIKYSNLSRTPGHSSLRGSLSGHLGHHIPGGVAPATAQLRNDREDNG